MSPLRYRKTKGYKYLVEDTYQASWPEFSDYTIDTRWYSLRAGVLTVFRGYAWDGCSGPTIDTASNMAAGLEHDVGYQMIRARELPAEKKPLVDAKLRQRMLEYPSRFETWAKIRAGYYFHAVRLFGRRSTQPRAIEPQDKVYAV